MDPEERAEERHRESPERPELRVAEVQVPLHGLEEAGQDLPVHVRAHERERQERQGVGPPLLELRALGVRHGRDPLRP